MSVVAPGPQSEEALDALLGQLAESSFVLTDGQGAVSKWSEPADLLFGRSAPDALGRGFFDTLITAPLSPGGEGWRRFLQAGTAPDARAKVELQAQHATGHAFAIELVMIPVKLDEGFDFSLFLEDLAFELEPAQMLMRLRGQHPVVVRALRAALSEEPLVWDPSWRTAGTLIAFRPLCATPWVDAERESRARAAAENESAMMLPEPVVEMDATEAIAGFADASQIVERLLGAVHKLDALEAAAAELPAAVESARGRAESAEREARAARAELDRLRNPDPHPEVQARLERLESADPAALLRDRLAEVESASDALGQRAQEAVQLAQEALERPVAEPLGPVVEEVRELRERADAAARLATEALERPVAEPVGELVGELGERLSGLESAHSRMAALEDDLRGHADEAAGLAREALERPVAEPVGELRDRLAELESAQGRLGELEDELRGRAEEAGRLAREALDRPVPEPVGELRERLSQLEAAQNRLGDLERGQAELRGQAEAAARLAHEALERPLAAPGEPVAEIVEAELRERLAALESARERIGDLEREHGELRGRAEEAVRLAQEALQRPVAEPLDEVVSDLQELRGRAEEAQKLAREALERPVAEPTGELRDRLSHVEAAQGRIGDLERAQGELHGRAEEAAQLAREALERPVAEPVDDLRTEVSELRDALAGLRAEVAEAADVRRITSDVADDVAVLRDRVEGVAGEAAGLREMVAGMQALVETFEPAAARERREAALREELASVIATVQGFQAGFDEARQAAVAARREAERARAEAASAGADSERSVQKLSSAWMELLSPGHAPADANLRRLPSRRPPAPEAVAQRPARAGFDDVAAPMAVLALDGHFRELNPAFGTLVGYGEHEFTKAVWPSAHDRGDYREQQEQLRRMADGDLESVKIRSTYMHQQGLMVPVAGEIRVVKDAAGRPGHLLLRAEERAVH